MASSTRSLLQWGEDHTVYLNKLYSLYHDGISWEWQLCDIGYKGYPDPKYDVNGEQLTPDFLSIGPSGDVQHVDVKGFEYIEKHFNNEDSKISDKIEETISELTKYREIDDGMVESYLEKRGVSYEAKSHEIVVCLPYHIYNEYKSDVETAVMSNDLILWVVNINGDSKIWKPVGQHINTELQEEMSEGLTPYPSSDDLIQFTRQTETAVKKFDFIKRLVKYCSQNQTNTFKFDELDQIMTGNRPRLLYHLPEDERLDIWRNYLYSMIHHLEMLEHGEGENEYRWKRKRFTDASRDRHQIFAKARSELGLGEEP